MVNIGKFEIVFEIVVLVFYDFCKEVVIILCCCDGDMLIVVMVDLFNVVVIDCVEQLIWLKVEVFIVFKLDILEKFFVVYDCEGLFDQIIDELMKISGCKGDDNIVFMICVVEQIIVVVVCKFVSDIYFEFDEKFLCICMCNDGVF